MRTIPGLTYGVLAAAVDVVLGTDAELRCFASGLFNSHSQGWSPRQMSGNRLAESSTDTEEIGYGGLPLARADIVQNTCKWLRENMPAGDTALARPAAGQIALVQLCKVVAGRDRVYVLLEIEEKKPFGAHQLHVYYHDHIITTGDGWNVEDVVRETQLLMDLEETYDHTLPTETTLADVERALWSESQSEGNSTVHTAEVDAHERRLREFEPEIHDGAQYGDTPDIHFSVDEVARLLAQYS